MRTQLKTLGIIGGIAPGSSVAGIPLLNTTQIHVQAAVRRLLE
jgi:aspartate/glutamate racemase